MGFKKKLDITTMARTIWPVGKWPRPDHVRTRGHEAAGRGGEPKQQIKQGRPRKWPTPGHLRKEVSRYFESCVSIDFPLKHDNDGEPYREEVVTQVKPFTMTGLATFLKCHRMDLLYYRGLDGGYLEVIQEAKTKCEAYAEEFLFSGKSTQGAIFAMKNNFQDWHDTRREEITGLGGGPLSVQVNDERARASRAKLLQQVEGKAVQPELSSASSSVALVDSPAPRRSW